MHKKYCIYFYKGNHMRSSRTHIYTNTSNNIYTCKKKNTNTYAFSHANIQMSKIFIKKLTKKREKRNLLNFFSLFFIFYFKFTYRIQQYIMITTKNTTKINKGEYVTADRQEQWNKTKKKKNKERKIIVVWTFCGSFW